MEKIYLSARMAAVADFVPEGAHLVDVGTDHGYIPLWLLQEGKIATAIASDVREGPLQHAIDSAKATGLSNQIKFLLCDGLSPLCETCCDTVIIAGMGGETIIKILQRAPWTKQNVSLILQPQSKIEILHEWLEQNGYAIFNVRLVKDAGRIYGIYLVRGGTSRALSTPGERYADRLLLQQKDPLLPEYLDGVIKKFRRSISGLQQAKKQNSQVLLRQQAILEDLESMRKETRAWQL